MNAISKMYGQQVYVSHCLTTNPPHSSDGRYGYMIDGVEIDTTQRIPCNATGKICSCDTGRDDVVLIGFFNDNLGEQTMAFALLDDVMPVPSHPSWPENTDYMTVIGHDD